MTTSTAERLAAYTALIAEHTGCPAFQRAHETNPSYCDNRDCYCFAAAKAVFDLESVERIIIPIKD